MTGHKQSAKRKAVELYRRGFSGRQVAYRVGASHRNVYRWLHEAGVVRNQSEASTARYSIAKGLDLRKSRRRALVLLRESQVPANRIAAMVGVTPQTVSLWAKDDGIDLQERRRERGWVVKRRAR